MSLLYGTRMMQVFSLQRLGLVFTLGDSRDLTAKRSDSGHSANPSVLSAFC